MNQRARENETLSRMLDIQELQEYVSLGRNNAMKLGADAGARVKIGRRVLFDRKKVDEYLNKLLEVS